MNAAIYVRSARAEGPGQEQNAGQRAKLHAHAHRRGFTVAAVYEDAGVSGLTPPAHRPDFARLLADAATDRFAVVVVAGFDRISRQASQARSAIRELKRLGVTVESVAGEPLEVMP